MAILSSVVSWLMKKRMHQIELFIKYPHDVQAEWFRRLINHGKSTEWGRKYDYRSIKTYQQYTQNVPISKYEDIKPYIDRLRNGEQNILWPEEIRWFAKSSGTTSSKSKFIPVSNSSLEECHFKGGKDMLSLYVNNFPDTEVFDGKGLVMGGSHNITEVNNESYYDGDLSAILIQNLPFWAQFMKTPNLSTALMDEWESKIEKMAAETMTHDVTSISGVPSWTLVLLKRILELTEKHYITDVWPNLEVFFHGGVNFDPYRQQFLSLIRDGSINYMETYNASEGFFGIQDQAKVHELLLMLDYGVFYEFVPVDQLDSDNPQSYQLGEVEKDRNYALVISTNAGLWRYMIGDTIRFTSLNPYRIKITGRTKNFINAVGEELIVDNAENALTVACGKCKVTINEYTASPLYFDGNEKASHEWLIEFNENPSDLDYFSETLDNALKSLNSDYEAKRYHNMVLKEPVVRVMKKGTFYTWLKQNNKLGGQHKVPRLSNNRDISEEILRINQTV
ncbi:MAG: GH3 auxin-responsive promoter family protein [Bacteroidales bacterium]|nr:GH3 auxin-responsive promoter family protein [Bacteroidales bacterium]